MGNKRETISKMSLTKKTEVDDQMVVEKGVEEEKNKRG